MLLALCHTPPARCTVFAALAAPCGVLASDIKGNGYGGQGGELGTFLKMYFIDSVSSVQLLSHVRLFCDPMDCSKSDFLVHHQLLESLLKLMSIELVMLSSHLILCCPLLFLSSIFTSIRVFFKESVLCIRR